MYKEVQVDEIKLIIDKIDTLAGVVKDVATDVREIKHKQFEQEKIQALMGEECIRRKKDTDRVNDEHVRDLTDIKNQLEPLFKVKAFLVVAGWIIGAIASLAALLSGWLVIVKFL